MIFLLRMRFRFLAFGLIAFFTVSMPPSILGFELKGYADINYIRSTNDEDLESNGAFVIGQLDLFMTQLIRDRIEVLSELVIESDTDNNFTADLERIQISYVLSDALTLHVGRFHNILGYWNTAFHHGALFQTTIERPAFLAFEDEGGILPVHLVGVGVSGAVKTSPLKVEYGAMAGNGSHVELNHTEPDEKDRPVLTPENIADPNKNKAVSANLTVWPSILTGLGLGVFSHFGRVPGFEGSLTTPKTMEVSQEIMGAHLIYSTTRAELLGEYYRVRDEDTLTDTGSFTSTAYYVQAGLHLTERLVPYARYEEVQVAEEDPYFRLLETKDSNRWVYGLRYAQNPDSVLKAEVQVIDQAGLDRYARYGLQWAFGF